VLHACSYGVEHPVVNDTKRALWGALGISSWPTQVVVSPAGKVLFSVAGEGHAQDIEDCVAAALEYYGEAGSLNYDTFPLVRARNDFSFLFFSEAFTSETYVFPSVIPIKKTDNTGNVFSMYILF
jgi:hypothetical protein